MRHRSDEDHGMFWAIMQRAYECWPEQHPFRPDSRDHLYGWCLIEAGHKKCVEVETDNPSQAVAVVKAIYEVSGDEVHCIRLFGTPSGIRICTPKSLSYRTAGKKKYEDVRSAVYEIIESVLEVKIDELKRAKVA